MIDWRLIINLTGHKDSEKSHIFGGYVVLKNSSSNCFKLIHFPLKLPEFNFKNGL